jgi:RHS repeat-associated protein
MLAVSVGRLSARFARALRSILFIAALGLIAMAAVVATAQPASARATSRLRAGLNQAQPATPSSRFREAFPLLSQRSSGPLAPLSALTGSPPSTPSIISPISQTPDFVVPTSNPTLEVSSTDAEGDPISYQFQVSTDQTFATVTCQSGWLPTTPSWTLPDHCVGNDLTLNPGIGGGPFYWRAQAKDIDGSSAWTGAKHFKVYVPMLGEGRNWAMWQHGPLAVNLGTGNLVVNLPGPNFASVGGPLGVSLTWNEFDPVDYGLSPGWRLNALPAAGNPPSLLIDHQNLSGASKLDAAELQYPGGSSQWFHHVDGTSTFVPTHNSPGAVVTQNVDNTWTFTDSDGAVYQFNVENANGKATLKSIDFPQDRVSNGSSSAKLNYVFSTSDPTKLDHIIDVSGRQLLFVWNAIFPAGCGSPHLLCITLKDATGTEFATWTYDKDSNGRLSQINDGTRALFKLGYSTSGRVNTIQNANDLDPNNASPGYNSTHAISISYTQDTTSQQFVVTSIADGPIFTQPAGKQTSTWTFQYLRGVAASPTRAPHAGIAQGTVRTPARETKITPPNQQGAGSPKTINYFIDGVGHPVEIDDALGHVSEFQYDYNETGNLEWSEDNAGSPTDNTWDSLNNILLQTQAPDAGGGLGRPMTIYRYDEKAIGTAAIAGPPLQGLQGWYFNNKNLTGAPIKETDSTVDFNWGTTGPPALSGQGTNYSVQWIGDINLPSTGDYTFSAVANGGTRMHVDQVHAFHNWTDSGTLTTTSSQSINLTAGAHTIMLDYFKGPSGSAEIHLHWSCANCSPAIPDQVIPQANLIPAWNNQTSTVSLAGRISFSHYASPWTSLPDYTLKQDSGTNYITSYSYDTYGRVLQKVMPKGNATATIDANGNLSGGGDTTYATTYTYYDITTTAQASGCPSPPAAANQAGQLQAKQPHGLTASTYVYDAFGSVLQQTNAKGTTCNTYTAHEDLLNTSKAPGETLANTYTYDPVGALRSVIGDGGVVITEHDEGGRISTLTNNYVNNFGPTATYAYDQNGNLTSRLAKTGTTQSSNTTNYTYNDGDQLTSIQDPASRVYSFYYDVLGNLHATRYPNTTFSWIDRNADSWITAVYNRHGTWATIPATVPADSQSSPLSDFAYTYNNDGEKTQEVRTGGGLATEASNYGYDNLGRLATVTLPDGTNRIYGYDLDSSRSQITENGSSVATYTYDPNSPNSPGLDELTSVTQGPTTNYTYTGDGQVNGRGTDTLTWDGRGRLSGGAFGGTTVSYKFDPTGFRWQRTSGSATVWYALGGMFQGTGTTLSDTNLTNTDIDGAAAADLAHYSGLPRTTTLVSYEYYNGHGDLAAEADTSGNRTSAYAYDPFGYLREGTTPGNSTSERFTAAWDKKLDSASSLIEMGARPYDPAIGVFYSADPIDSGCFSSYSYANDDPISLYDLSGATTPCGHISIQLAVSFGRLRSVVLGALVTGHFVVALVSSFIPISWEFVYSWGPGKFSTVTGSGSTISPETFGIIVEGSFSFRTFRRVFTFIGVFSAETLNGPCSGTVEGLIRVG